jgi:phosphoribosylanthranilate isomerase
LGLVFYAPSPRAVTDQQARELVRGMPPFVTLVGLFVDAEAATIRDLVARLGIDLVQLHGDESPEFCASLGLPYIKAVRMRAGLDLVAEARCYAGARALLLDAYRPGVPGGTGECFDWRQVPDALAGRVILAGGLTPDNVATAIRQVRPYAVDVSGGVERGKGIKDAAKMADFIRGVRLGDDDED